VRAYANWAALVVLLLVLAVEAPLRGGLADTVALAWLGVLWFFLARTKTLSWQALAGLFAVCLPWSLLIGFLTRGLAGAVGPGAFGSSTVLAALAEESLTLVPLLAVVVVAPARVRRFAVADWLLAGLFIGLALQTVEALARNTYGDYGLGPLAGGASVPGVAGFPGQHVLTALVTVSIGLGVAAWRHSTRPHVGPTGLYAWRTAGVVVPLLIWWSAVCAHAGYNAGRVLGSDQWSTGDGVLMPWSIRFGWRVTGHGFGLGWLLLLFLLLALLVDAGRLRAAADEADDPLTHPFSPPVAADAWAGRLTRWAGTSSALPIAAVVWLVAAGCSLVAYALRDLLVVVLASGPDPQSVAAPAVEAAAGERARARSAAARPESRWAAITRGRAAGVMVRSIRAEAIALAAGPDGRGKRRSARALGLSGLAGALLAAFWLGPYWAGKVGDDVTVVLSAAGQAAGAPTVWLGGALERLGPWWSALSAIGLVLVVAGAVALIVLAAGPLDLPLGDLGRNSFLIDRFAAAPDFFRDPAGWAKVYFSMTTPTEVATDGAVALAGLLPPSVAGRTGGPAAAKQVRVAVREFLDDPARFTAGRRAAAKKAAQYPSASDDTAPIRLLSNADLPAVKLADGRLLSALSAHDERVFIATLDDLIRGNIQSRNEAADYQVRIYGDDERLISQRPQKWSDGHNTAYAMVADAVFYDGRGPNWWAPHTLPESIRHKAYLEIDRRLIEYATAVYYPASPFQGLEVTTNNEQVAAALRERMARLAIPGYVVLEP
jgi:hypothetical protein